MRLMYLRSAFKQARNRELMDREDIFHIHHGLPDE
jgi:hypothetical protein